MKENDLTIMSPVDSLYEAMANQSFDKWWAELYGNLAVSMGNCDHCQQPREVENQQLSHIDNYMFIPKKREMCKSIII